MWSGDIPNGYGRQQWKSKKVSYEGQFLNGRKHGDGKYMTPQFEYQGVFNCDQFDSFGSIIYSNGEKYEGNYQKGKKNGKGTNTWPDGSYYEGFYKNDLKHGQGRYQSAEQSCWEGEWVNGKRQGIGALKIGNKRYPAQWSNGQPAYATKASQISRKMSQLSVETFKP